ncbi:MAG: glycosyltransferase family 4 protein [Acidobacteria bacterium]|nr:glycosyltransferase family 4 protein [Acidobacteriota bacterium]MBU4307788.1 glycosyltransferase family 4 protein [Acidobacteriota bacterium]MCG2810395.1 glycosyltransferase family 4 protein [Candidatus Aminicenantes bacterium]
MRIAINLLYLLPGVVGGTETYAAGLLHGLALVDSQNEYIVFVNRESASWPIPLSGSFKRVICQVAATNRAQRYFFEQFRLPGLLKNHGVDLVHSLGYVGPLRTPCPAVVTVPDLNYLTIGHTMPLGKRHLLRFFSIQAAQRSKAVITISSYSKSMICDKLEIHPSKVTVTLLGPRWDDPFISQDVVSKIKASYGISVPYLVAFGGGAVHKNIPRLLQALAALKKDLSHKLVLIGRLPADVDPEELPADIIVTGYVPAEHVLPLLSAAEIFILPSLHEGFGLPVLEAQQAGVPVVCSTAGSLPEVAGEGATYFDPYSVEDMADKIARVARDSELRTGLRQRGLVNVKRFSWEQTARETLSVYTQVYEKRRQL